MLMGMAAVAVASACNGYMRNTPILVGSVGALYAALSPSPSTVRVSSGSITPSSHRLHASHDSALFALTDRAEA